MRSMIVVSLFAAAVIVTLAGCSTKPPRDVDAAVRQRLTRYSQAWERGDAAGVRESFHARDADEAALRDAIADLAPAQAALRTAYFETLDPAGRIVFGDGDPSQLIIASRPWESYAKAAAQPQQLIYKKPIVLARLGDAADRTFHVRNAGGDWKLDVRDLVEPDTTPELARTTRRQVRHTNEMTAAVRSRDRARIQQAMMRHLVEVRGPARRTIEAVSAPTTAPAVRAKENPP